MIEITTFETRESLMGAAAARIAEALKQGISERGRGFAALSGGSTPEPAYRKLATLSLDWPRVRFLLVDERFLPPSDVASNEAMLRRTLAPALSAGAKFPPMYASGMAPAKAADRANALYQNKPIDIALMGMGGDGHTASWFPQSPQREAVLNPSETRTVMAVDAPGAAGSPQRLTLTRFALAEAREIILLIAGREKRALLEDKQRPRLPVDALFDLPARTHVFWAT